MFQIPLDCMYVTKMDSKITQLGNWAKFPEITTFSIKYVSFLALCLRFRLQTTFSYKSNIAELPPK